jgi:hypothetical protein
MKSNKSLIYSISLKMFLLLILLFFVFSCGGGNGEDGSSEDAAADGTPTPTGIASSLISELSDNLLLAGYSEDEAAFIVAGATTLIATENLTESTDVAAASPVVLKGAMISLSDSSAAISTSDEKLTAIDVIIGSITQSLNGRVTSSQSSLLSSASKYLIMSLISDPNRSSLGSIHAAIMKLMAQVAIQQLDETGIPNVDMTYAVKQVSKYLVKSLSKAGIANEDLANVTKEVTTAAVGALNETSLTTIQISSAIEAVIIGIMNGLNDFGASSAVIADIADDVAAGAASGLIDAGISSDDASTYTSTITTAVSTGAKEAGLTDSEISEIEQEIEDAAYEILNPSDDTDTTTTDADADATTTSTTTTTTDADATTTSTTSDTTAPTVSNISPTNNSTDVSINTTISVIFSETMDTSTITTNTSNTSCSGTFQVSKDDFTNCIRMSNNPIASNDNKMFTISPFSNLPGLTTYNIKVTDSVKDEVGNNMTSTYTAANGFVTLPGPLTGVWNFVDGDGANGINKNTDNDAEEPHIIEFNTKLYAAWSECNTNSNNCLSGIYNIRVSEWNGTSSWSFIDGNGTNGINKATNQDASSPKLTVFNTKLYAIWSESTVSTFQIRVAEWDGTSTWSFVDGDGTNGINKNTGQHAFSPKLIEFNSKLYAIWSETNGANYQIRVAEWNGSSTWSFVDGDGANGINKNAGQHARSPQVTVYNSKLYATWNEPKDSCGSESKGLCDQIRVAEWDGTSNWNFIDGNGIDGINKNITYTARNPQLTEFNSKLYVAWNECNTNDCVCENGLSTCTGRNQIRAAEWNGTSTWNFVDGDGTNGTNKNTGQFASGPKFQTYNSKLYLIWQEQNSSSISQIRAAEWDGSSTWSFVDGNGTNGLNKDTGQHAMSPQIIANNFKMYSTWYEETSSKAQIRVIVAETE